MSVYYWLQGYCTQVDLIFEDGYGKNAWIS